MIDAVVFSLRENQLRYRRRICHERLMRVRGHAVHFSRYAFHTRVRHKSLASLATSSIPMLVVNSGNFLVPGMRSPDVHPNYPYWENIIMSADRLGKTSTKLSCFPANARRIVRWALVHRGGLYDRLLSGRICKISCIFIRICADVLRQKKNWRIE